jgi:hypothetical protein
LESKKVNKFCLGMGDGEELTQIMYIHASKCKNDKIKIINIEKRILL